MESDKKSSGALIGSIIIILILIIGGIYLLKNTTKEKLYPEATDQVGYEENSTTSLEAELESMELDSIDGEI